MPGMGDTSVAMRFGWQGIELDVPASWELSAYSGDQDVGYAALDDGEQLRLHVRWNRRRPRRVDLSATSRQYKRSLRKKTKGRVEFQELCPEFLPVRYRKARSIVPFQWEGEQTAWGLAWHCRVCGCVGLLEVVFPSAEADRKLARLILSSLVDHRDDGRRLWAVYGFAFLTPAVYNLERPELTAGRLRFTFRASKRARLTVERWSMASEWLKKAPLENWPGELLKRDYRGGSGRLEQVATRVQGRQAWRFTQQAGRQGIARTGAREGLLWHCVEEDKIYAVLAQEAEDGLLDEVAMTVKCA